MLDLQFNPGSGIAPGATALVSNVVAPVLDGNAPLLDGNASGALPGNVSFDNGTAFNALLQGVQTFTNTIQFRVRFDGPFLTAGSGAGTTFSLGLLAPNLDVLPNFATDASGRILSFELSPGNITFAAFDPAVHVTPVPEPEAFALLLAGLVLVGWHTRGRQA